MSHNRDTAIDDPFDFFFDHHTAFQLHCLYSGFLNKAGGVPQGIFHGNMVSHERHIAHDQGVRGAADNGFTVVNHYIHGHRQGVFIPQYYHA